MSSSKRSEKGNELYLAGAATSCKSIVPDFLSLICSSPQTMIFTVNFYVTNDAALLVTAPT